MSCWTTLGPHNGPKQYQNFGEILGETAVDNCIIWRMAGTTAGAYCQQWIANRGATCICDAVFLFTLTISIIAATMIIDVATTGGGGEAKVRPI